MNLIASPLHNTVHSNLIETNQNSLFPQPPPVSSEPDMKIYRYSMRRFHMLLVSNSLSPLLPHVSPVHACCVRAAVNHLPTLALSEIDL